jgi:hypothetical protein
MIIFIFFHAFIHVNGPTTNEKDAEQWNYLRRRAHSEVILECNTLTPCSPQQVILPDTDTHVL